MLLKDPIQPKETTLERETHPTLGSYALRGNCSDMRGHYTPELGWPRLRHEGYGYAELRIFGFRVVRTFKEGR